LVCRTATRFAVVFTGAAAAPARHTRFHIGFFFQRHQARKYSRPQQWFRQDFRLWHEQGALQRRCRQQRGHAVLHEPRAMSLKRVLFQRWYGAPVPPSARLRVTMRADVWSLGCCVYELAYGRHPFAPAPGAPAHMRYCFRLTRLLHSIPFCLQVASICKHLLSHQLEPPHSPPPLIICLSVVELAHDVCTTEPPYPEHGSPIVADFIKHCLIKSREARPQASHMLQVRCALLRAKTEWGVRCASDDAQRNDFCCSTL
jgi:serine/threonine protein kinase